MFYLTTLSTHFIYGYMASVNHVSVPAHGAIGRRINHSW